MTDGPEAGPEPVGACASCADHGNRGGQQVGSGLAVGGGIGELNVYIGQLRVLPDLGALMRSGLGEAVGRLAQVTRATADFFDRHTPQQGRLTDEPAAEGTDP
ncbi:hypothetical protein [Kitasatospora phosalacinea]|uniref:Uncharacterized protein n=1 Tax=Kitasatospora phosalacinea TaxID=2065 RepID=A0A9W6PDU9_9ACTN|nr:hypothetical protein [Kitasatospora phosalacinea]GLW53286.1 hypothetical protein Kpho01_12970 [Kitasatospora phosalacinea]